MNASTIRRVVGIVFLFVNLFPAFGLAQTPNPCPNSAVTMQYWDGATIVQICGHSRDPISMAVEAKAAGGLLRAAQYPYFGAVGYGVDPSYVYLQSQNAAAAYNLAAELREAMVSQVASSSFEEAVRDADRAGRADGQHAAVMRGLGEVRTDIAALRKQIVAAEVRTRRELASAITSGNDNLKRELEARMSNLRVVRLMAEKGDPEAHGFFWRLFHTPDERVVVTPPIAPPTSTTSTPPPPPPTTTGLDLLGGRSPAVVPATTSTTP